MTNRILTWTLLVALAAASGFLGYRVGELQKLVIDQEHYINEGCPVPPDGHE